MRQRTWLNQRSVESVRGALDRRAPDLSGGSITLQPWTPTNDPQWSVGTAVVERRFITKFAWSEVAADRLWYEGQVLRSLGTHAPDLPLPRVVLASDDPVLLVTELVEGDPLTYDMVGRSDGSEVDQIGAELAGFLSNLHRPEVLAQVIKAMGPLEIPHPQATTADLRARVAPWLRPDQRDMVHQWCEWVDDVLDVRGDTVLVHGDLHGFNQVWDSDRLRLRVVVDFESSGASEADYDFRYLPAQGPGVGLLLATVTHYQDRTGRMVNVDHVMAWHIRTVLGDALWRSEAGVPLPGGGTPPEWVDELSSRLHALTVGPSRASEDP